MSSGSEEREEEHLQPEVSQRSSYIMIQQHLGCGDCLRAARAWRCTPAPV